MKLFQKIKSGWYVFIIVVLFFLLAKEYYLNNRCSNPFELRDYTKKKNEFVKICKDVIIRGKSRVLQKKEYQDLFQIKVAKKYEPTKQYIRVFELEGKEYVSIISVADYSFWVKSAIGIYRKENNSYKPIFAKGFEENHGRYSNIVFSTSDYDDYHQGLVISGDVGHLGCYGCRINWHDFYNWDSTKKTYVVSNNKRADEFRNLLKEYEEQDVRSCNNTSASGKSISELYPKRKDKEKFCDDSAVVPYVSSDQVAIFLKAKKAIEKILEGENISIKDIKNISLEN